MDLGFLALLKQFNKDSDIEKVTINVDGTFEKVSSNQTAVDIDALDVDELLDDDDSDNHEKVVADNVKKADPMVYDVIDIDDDDDGDGDDLDSYDMKNKKRRTNDDDLAAPVVDDNDIIVLD